ncbi:glycosyl-4,4'-diaponeurosporenoate acyltransferase CrtO family protein [Mucilaginibacter terrae]|uniref:Glycosyl-4,4'-diaponeurosporenoate acyltransferase n=1 Tax=Mucilaginibacter terrae TaxID=1955052 RepID=A0ABU3GRW5_9SPHI|nr:hypothetical protein [Mucilaginibacter terrae]MDT3402527.1 hypothetical protein [Mucilaginibacter terrae]
MKQKPLFKKYAIVALATLVAVAFIGVFYVLGLKTSMFLFAWQLNFALMAWISVVNAQLKPRLRSSYFDAFAFEQDGKIYAYLGVNWFRRFLVLVGWEKITRKNMPVSNSISDIKKYERATRESEYGHWIVAIIVILISIYIYIQYSLVQIIWLMVLNVLFNIYPIFLQRYNRPRLQIIISRYSSIK